MELALRLLTFNAPHSGYNDPPRFGDFQAHRHWMFLTNTLPIHQWYLHNNSHTYNNISTPQWVLDYPPVTAYAHFLYGKSLNKQYSNHGNQDDLLIIKMRFFILLIDIALIVAIHKLFKSFKATSVVTLFLCHPMFLLIDYIHYQPNNLMFLFLTLSIICLMKSSQTVNSGTLYPMLGTISFLFCILSKQMSLVYAPVMGMAYLSLCLKQPTFSKQISLIFKLGVAVVVAISICIIPFALPYNNFANGLIVQSSAILSRVFPIHRGLFEDKLGNFWCISDVIFKWRRHYSEALLARICTFLCLFLTVPIGFKVYNKVTLQSVLSGCATSSMVGFLFGYHVHEKTILLPIFCILLLSISMRNTNRNNKYVLKKYLDICSFNIFPLVVLDGAVFEFIALHLIWWALHNNTSSASFRGNRIAYKTLIDVVYHPVIYGLLALLQGYPLIVVDKYPFLFNLFIYAWCLLGNLGCLLVLIQMVFNEEDDKVKVT